MIKSITLKNIATYDNEGVIIDGLCKINLLYGANATGKTTLSNYIQSYQNNDIFPEAYKDCSLCWENDVALECFVYNKKFKEQYFATDELPGIFTLGKASKEQKDAIANAKNELDQIKLQKTTFERSKNKIENEKNTQTVNFQQKVWQQIFKIYDNDFYPAFSGVRNSKENFCNKLIAEYEQNKSQLKSLNDLQERSSVIFNSAPFRMETIALINNTFIDRIENAPEWKQKIIGSADVNIAQLIQRLNIDDWVNQGRSHLIDGSDVCPFCQQHTITDSFRKQIDAYFGDTFTEQVSKLKQYEELYNQYSENILNSLNDIITKEKENSQSKLDIDSLQKYIDLLATTLKNNISTIEAKRKEPSRSMDIISTSEIITNINSIISNTNNKIKQHNSLVDNFQIERQSLIGEIWQYIITTHKDIIDEHINELKKKTKAITSLTQKITQLTTLETSKENEIKELNKTVTSIQPAIDEINKILKGYGFTNFQIVEADKPNYYSLTRDNKQTDIHRTLSEGEITFITFLYFIQLIQGSFSEGAVTTDRVVVIDDPISSLDSNILFVVSSLVKELLNNVQNNVGNIKQIILLTHNIYFHKEVAFLDGREQTRADTAYFVLRRKDNVTSIKAYKQNPIHNSYELLWNELKEVKNSTEKILSDSTIQNIMRRIIETYFKLLGKYKDDTILDKFEDPQEKIICKSLLYWINDGSHCIPDDLYVEQPELTDRYFHVFKQVFEKTHHIEHYNMMMGIDEDNIT